MQFVHAQADAVAAGAGELEARLRAGIKSVIFQYQTPACLVYDPSCLVYKSPGALGERWHLREARAADVRPGGAAGRACSHKQLV